MERSPSMRWWSRFFWYEQDTVEPAQKWDCLICFLCLPVICEVFGFFEIASDGFSYVPGAVQEWAKLSLAAESNGRYNPFFLCCLSAVECTRSLEIIKFDQKTKRHKNIQKLWNISKSLQIVQVCSKHGIYYHVPHFLFESPYSGASWKMMD